jgi:hypothetical protein
MLDKGDETKMVRYLQHMHATTLGQKSEKNRPPYHLRWARYRTQTFAPKLYERIYDFHQYVTNTHAQMI